MADFLLNSSGDLDITNGELTIVRGDDAILQHLKIRFQFFRGEWKLDKRLGIPYYQDILVKSPDLLIVRNLFRQTILTTPGIASITKFRMELDSTTRTLSVAFTAAKDEGGTLDFSDAFIIGES